MSKFEKFVHKRLQSSGEPMLTITKVGIINFNSATMAKYIKDNTYATLYYDKRDSVIGIKFTKKRTAEAYHIIKYRGGKFGTISGLAFLKYYKIPLGETRAYNAEWNEQDAMLVADLKQHKREREKSKQILGQDV
ncbi:hypothetical protein GH153_06240 [bacterium]|nr:hypothetical protein [bacterium]